MTQNEFKEFREDILKGFQLTSKPTVKSISALFFSGLISTYGIYSILLSVGIEGNTMYKAIGIFILILIVADTFKRGALVKYYNSTIRSVIVGAKVLKMQLVVSILALAFMTVFDVVGSFSTANFVEAKYQEFQATNSKEFELLESNAKNGQSALTIYSQELTTWQQEKKDGYQICMEKWRGWKTKYKATCKEEWNTANPKPVKPTQNGSVSVADYKSVKDGANDDFLSEYIFYIILFLSLALTMLLQYTTISEIQDNKDEIDQSLTGMVIGILQDRLKELETNMIEHETQRNELISDSDKEEKRLGRDFETRGKAIGLLALGKAVDARGETVKRIANNESFSTGGQKAGFIVNPLYSEQKKNRWDEELINRYGGGYGTLDFLYYLWNDGANEKGDEVNKKVPKEKFDTWIDMVAIAEYSDGRLESLMNFEDAYKHYSKKGYYSTSGGISRYMELTGRELTEAEKKDIIEEEKSYAINEDNQKNKSESLTKMQMIELLYDGIDEREDNKLTSKTQIINVKNRTEDRHYKKVMKILEKSGIVQFKKGYGYYALKGLDDAINALKEVKQW